MAKHKLTPRQREVLEVLVKDEYAQLISDYMGWRVSTGGASFDVQNATATALIDRGLVQWTAFDPIEYTISDKGRKALDEEHK